MRRRNDLCFSAYAMYMTLRHPSFINPLIYFPLIILGGEMMFDGKRPYLFIISVCLAAVSGFYFFYVISIFTILYVFLRIFFAYPKDKLLKGFFQALFKFGGSYLLGMIMAAVTLLPMIITVLFQTEAQFSTPLIRFMQANITKNSSAHLWDMCSLTAMFIWALRRREQRQLCCSLCKEKARLP